MTGLTFDIPTLLVVTFVLTGVVNILTQVIKQLTWDKIPTNLLAFIVSQAVTLVVFFAYCSIYSVLITWYLAVAAVVVGFFVAFAAMFGYDKLREIIDGWTKGGK